MSEKERLKLENELLMTCSKAQAINKYIDELEENSKLSELWCKSQQENQALKNSLTLLEKNIIQHNDKQRDLYKNVIDEVNEFIKEFHNYENRFKWCESDYIDTIEKIEEILDKAKEIDN